VSAQAPPALSDASHFHDVTVWPGESITLAGPPRYRPATVDMSGWNVRRRDVTAPQRSGPQSSSFETGGGTP
jgi:hypothetical protein